MQLSLGVHKYMKLIGNILKNDKKIFIIIASIVIIVLFGIFIDYFANLCTNYTNLIQGIASIATIGMTIVFHGGNRQSKEQHKEYMEHIEKHRKNYQDDKIFELESKRFTDFDELRLLLSSMTENDMSLEYLISYKNKLLNSLYVDNESTLVKKYDEIIILRYTEKFKEYLLTTPYGIIYQRCKQNS